MRQHPYRHAETQRDRAHLAIAKAIDDAKAERLGAQRRSPLPALAPLLGGAACGVFGFAFTGHLVVAAVAVVFGVGGVLIPRAIGRLPPHGDDPPLRHG